MPFVVDNSVVVGWYFESQATPYTDKVLDLLANETVHVPALWVLEFSNVLRKALKAGKANTARIQEIIALVNALPISVDYTSENVGNNLALPRWRGKPRTSSTTSAASPASTAGATSSATNPASSSSPNARTGSGTQADRA